MNFPEFSFVDPRLSNVINHFHPLGAARGQFADPEARQLYDEIQAMSQAQGAKPIQVGKLLTEICDGELIRDQRSVNPNFTIDKRVHNGYLKTAARTGAETLYNALSARAAEIVGKTVVVEQVNIPVLTD